MKDNTEQAFSHCFLSTHAQHFFKMNVKDANIQRSRLCMNIKVKTDQGTWIKDLPYGHKEDFFLRELRREILPSLVADQNIGLASFFSLADLTM